MSTPSQDQIFEHIKSLLIELFEIPPEKITPSAQLSQDLDVDSIDAVDLMIKLKEYTGRKVRPEDFKQVRTVADVVGAVQGLMLQPA